MSPQLFPPPLCYYVSERQQIISPSSKSCPHGLFGPCLLRRPGPNIIILLIILVFGLLLLLSLSSACFSSSDVHSLYILLVYLEDKKAMPCVNAHVYISTASHESSTSLPRSFGWSGNNICHYCAREHCKRIMLCECAKCYVSGY